MGGSGWRGAWSGCSEGGSVERQAELRATSRALEPRQTLGPPLEAASERMRWEDHPAHGLSSSGAG